MRFDLTLLGRSRKTPLKDKVEVRGRMLSSGVKSHMECQGMEQAEGCFLENMDICRARKC